MFRKLPPHLTALVLLLVVAFFLRGCNLSQRPMHADEANQAVKFGELLEHGNYWFDPADHHGPTLYYFTLPLAWLKGQTTLVSLTEATLRLSPAIFGTIAVLLTALLAAPLGRVAMVAAAAFIAVAPATVYFSRYFIQETFLLTFTLAALLCGREWLRTSRLPWALAMGACAGLMQATKALAPLFAVAALVGLWIEYGMRMPPPARLRGFIAAFVMAGVVAALFYSSFGQNPAGLRDAVSGLGTMFDRATAATSGHEKPVWYYASILTENALGYADWRVGVFLALALGGYFISWRGREPLMRFLVVYSTIVAGVISFVPYKTPWVVIHVVPGLAVFAGEFYERLTLQRRVPPMVPIALAVAGVLLLTSTMWGIVFTRSSDWRNPFAYVHSVPDVLKVRPLAETARRSHPREAIKIISPEYWPLPWYLRGIPGVGYWREIPEDCDGALVIVSAELADQVKSRLHGDYTMSYLGLRPGVVLAAFVKSTGTAP